MSDTPQGVVLTLPSLAGLGALAVAMSAFTFALGLSLGSAPEGPGAAAFTSEVPSEALVDLLARVEAATQDEGAVRKLTYPEELLGVVQGPALPSGSAPEASTQSLEVQLDLADGVTRNRLPEGPLWLVLAEDLPLPEAEVLRRRLEAESIVASLVPELRQGRPYAQVVVGGFLEEGQAEGWISDRSGLLQELQLAPKVRAAD